MKYILFGSSNPICRCNFSPAFGALCKSIDQKGKQLLNITEHSNVPATIAASLWSITFQFSHMNALTLNNPLGNRFDRREWSRYAVHQALLSTHNTANTSHAMHDRTPLINMDRILDLHKLCSTCIQTKFIEKKTKDQKKPHWIIEKKILVFLSHFKTALSLQLTFFCYMIDTFISGFLFCFANFKPTEHIKLKSVEIHTGTMKIDFVHAQNLLELSTICNNLSFYC